MVNATAKGHNCYILAVCHQVSIRLIQEQRLIQCDPGFCRTYLLTVVEEGHSLRGGSTETVVEDSKEPAAEDSLGGSGLLGHRHQERKTFQDLEGGGKSAKEYEYRRCRSRDQD